MNQNIEALQAYPFERLDALLAAVRPPVDLPVIRLSIGEPKHASPALVREALVANLNHLATYPSTKGVDALRISIADWAAQRFGAQLNPASQVLPVNGTREALFAFAQAVVDVNKGYKPMVAMPNPFYQIYEGAALLAGAEPYFINASPANGWLGDYTAVPADVWQQTQLLYVCSPGNPTGAVLSAAQWQALIALADQYDFIIAADECYSELYVDAPPVGLLQVCAELGRSDYKSCVVFHSLSKRSNLPGLRSGFVAGDSEVLARYFKYRTYHGAALPVQHQMASIAAWQDEAHVLENRALYAAKYALFADKLGALYGLEQPAGGFYYWLKVADDLAFAQTLYAQQHMVVLPGRFLSRQVNGVNPGVNYVRLALVASMAECELAAHRLTQFALHNPHLLCPR